MAHSRKTTLKKLSRLIDYRNKGLIPHHHTGFHETPFLHPDSKESFLYYTFPSALASLLPPEELRPAAYETRHDADVQYVFYPEEVVVRSYDQLHTDLGRYALNQNDEELTRIWWILAHTFHFVSESDPRIFLEQLKYDVLEIRSHLQEFKDAFPHLTSQHGMNYWLYTLYLYTSAQFKNKHYIAMIEYPEVIDASRALGLISHSDESSKLTEKRDELLDGTGIAPIQLYPILHSRTKNNFFPKL